MLDAKTLRNKQTVNTIPGDKPGYYKWWAEKSEVDLILKELNITYDFAEQYFEKKGNLYCIYVGIAAKESIRKRLDWHVNDKHTPSRVKNGTLSTLRQSISSVVAHNQYDKTATDDFINKLSIEYYTINSPIKSTEAIEKLHSIERDLMQRNWYLLNIRDNKFVYAKPAISALKALRKQSKCVFRASNCCSISQH